MLQVERMINDIKESFLGILDKSEWMDKETKLRAIKKVSNLICNNSL